MTVIIPTYHWSTVLPFSMASVLRQTFTDFELLVIGDGCTDDTESVVARVGDARTRWINLPANTGHQSGPNNEGLRQAKGEFIAYLGQDDLWLPHHLALAVAAMDAGADMTYGICAIVMPGDAPIGFAPSELDDLLPGDWIPPSVILHRRDMAQAVGGWKRFVDVSVDPESDLMQRLTAIGARRKFVRRLTAIKFPAIYRKDAYKRKPCEEQAHWWGRIQNEPDLEATELARMLTPLMEGQRAQRPWQDVWFEFRQDVAARLRRKMIRMKLLRKMDRNGELRQRRRYKGAE